MRRVAAFNRPALTTAGYSRARTWDVPLNSAANGKMPSQVSDSSSHSTGSTDEREGSRLLNIWAFLIKTNFLMYIKLHCSKDCDFPDSRHIAI